MTRLAGRTALITGGSSGIGLAAARAFLDAGAQVGITARDAARLERAAASLASNRLSHRAADVSDAGGAAELADWARQTLGAIDILVNNAGLNIKDRSIRQLDPAAWDHLIRSNLHGAFHCIHALLPGMRERGGLVININSVAGKRALPLSGAGYSAAKFGLRALTDCLAAEEKDHGIRVCGIYPGEVDTPILDQRPEPMAAERRRALLRPEDVAEAILWVACLPPRVSVPELVITPSSQWYL